LQKNYSGLLFLAHVSRNVYNISMTNSLPYTATEAAAEFTLPTIIDCGESATLSYVM